MTVEELIQELQKLPADAYVYVRGYEYGVEDIKSIVSPAYINRDANSDHGHWAGRHDIEPNPEYLDDPYNITEGVYLNGD